jgi:hypothetical protein
MIYANVFILLIVTMAAPSTADCVPAPALAALFTPPRPELGRYEVCTTERPLEEEAEALEPLDAFGAAGSYDRATLQRLYGSARVRVGRSWTATASEFVATTRLSPYPDATLTHLHAGTMEIRFIIRRSL